MLQDIGYGEIKNCNGKGPAFEKVKKEGATDGMKRALRNFGNVLGNCLYDKSYLTKVAKVKAGPSRWSEDNLHRHPEFVEPKTEPLVDTPAEADVQPKREFVALKRETIVDTPTEIDTQSMRRTGSEQSHISVATTDYDDEYGGNLFEEVDFSRPDESSIEATSMLENDTPDVKMIDRPSEVTPVQNRQQMPRVQSMPQMRTGQLPQGENQQGFKNAGPNQALARQQMQQGAGQMSNGNMNGRPQPMQNQNGRQMLPPQVQPDQNQQKPNGQPNQNTYAHIPPPPARAKSSTPEQTSQNNQRSMPQPQPPHINNQIQNGAPPPHEAPVGFITARAADNVKGPTVGVTLPPNVPKFNPHAESPSIRRTGGFNHNRTGPVTRDTINAAPSIDPPNLLNGGAPPARMVAPNLQNVGVPPARTNFVNPQADANRRIGMPGAMQSPGANRSAYKPPGPAGVKRGSEGISRAPLADMSNMQQQQQQQQGDSADAKRQKLAGT